MKYFLPINAKVLQELFGSKGFLLLTVIINVIFA